MVTGSTVHLVRATSKTLAQAGAKVLINGRTSEEKAAEIVEEIENAGGTAVSLMADVTDEISVKRMIETAAAEFGRLDILVNNVGPANKGPVTEISYADWRNIMAQKLDSAFLTIKHAVPYLAKGGRGAIINVGASSAHTGNPQRSVDVAAKMGLAGLTGSLAVELA
ncbi:MAG: SDR family NAD(P)-dependent oxidoreductase, partial [Rhodospirillaceae bacterium]